MCLTITKWCMIDNSTHAFLSPEQPTTMATNHECRCGTGRLDHKYTQNNIIVIITQEPYISFWMILVLIPMIQYIRVEQPTWRVACLWVWLVNANHQKPAGQDSSIEDGANRSSNCRATASPGYRVPDENGRYKPLRWSKSVKQLCFYSICIVQMDKWMEKCHPPPHCLYFPSFSLSQAGD